jgi:hypothetical protein
LPTAKHEVALAHETDVSAGLVLPAGFGLATIDHAVPFQRSTSVRGVMPLLASPTAKQLVVLAHETPKRSLFPAPAGFGLATIDQAEPFQRSMSVLAGLTPDTPTAKQLVALGHETENRPGNGEPLGLGLATIDHTVPFQRRTSVLVSPFDWDAPTAKQLVVLAHAMSLRYVPPPGVVATLGLAMIDQLVPSQRSINELFHSPFVATPTAKHVLAAGQATLVKEPLGAPAGLALGTIDQVGAATAGPAVVIAAPAMSTDTNSRRESNVM